MSRKYTEEFKITIIELYKLGKSLAKLNAEYGTTKSIISTWVKENSPAVSSYEDSNTSSSKPKTKLVKNISKESLNIRSSPDWHGKIVYSGIK